MFHRFKVEIRAKSEYSMMVKVTRTDVSSDGQGWGQFPMLHVTLAGHVRQD